MRTGIKHDVFTLFARKRLLMRAAQYEAVTEPRPSEAVKKSRTTEPTA